MLPTVGQAASACSCVSLLRASSDVCHRRSSTNRRQVRAAVGPFQQRVRMMGFAQAWDLWLVWFHLAGERVGDEVDHMLARNHVGPWFSAWPACKVASEGAVVFTRKEKKLYWNSF